MIVVFELEVRMRIECKKCGSSENVKNGFSHGKQRYRCNKCGKNYVDGDGDRRCKYSVEKKLRVLKLYLEGVGIMSIERLEGVSNPLIIYWIRNAASMVRAEVQKARLPEEAKEIQILEIDELFSYCKKKITKCTYGFVLIDSEIKLLSLK